MNAATTTAVLKYLAKHLAQFQRTEEALAAVERLTFLAPFCDEASLKDGSSNLTIHFSKSERWKGVRGVWSVVFHTSSSMRGLWG